LVDKELDDRNV